jgi:hypothetical protein
MAFSKKFIWGEHDVYIKRFWQSQEAEKIIQANTFKLLGAGYFSYRCIPGHRFRTCIAVSYVPGSSRVFHAAYE